MMPKNWASSVLGDVFETRLQRVCRVGKFWKVSLPEVMRGGENALYSRS